MTLAIPIRATRTLFSETSSTGLDKHCNSRLPTEFVVAHHHALNRAITDVFTPRGGVAWDVTGNGRWLVKGGAGFFHNWPTLANLQEQYRGNPPGPIFPTFYGGQTPAPVFGLGYVE